MKRFFVLLILIFTGFPANAVASAIPAILVFGDSISAGYGLAHVEQGWVGRCGQSPRTKGNGYQVVNASVTGETTAGGWRACPVRLLCTTPGW